MNTADTFTATGHVRAELFDDSGTLILSQEMDNLVVTVGKNAIANRMQSAPSVGAMSHMAVGTGTTAAAAGDTALTTETARVALTSTTVTNNQVQYVGTFNPGTATAALTEAGIFNASSVGTLLAHVVFSAINKGANDTLTITWTVTIN